MYNNYKRKQGWWCVGLCAMSFMSQAWALPQGFVYLSDVAPTIQQELRYATADNFTGTKIAGYHAAKCILTEEAAQALAKAQEELLQSNYSLKVYDCYRPTKAIAAIKTWSMRDDKDLMKTAYYPREKKGDLFHDGYVMDYSSHSRGSTVDITIVPVQAALKTHPVKHEPQKSCILPQTKRMHDSSLDMGTNYDCMDVNSHYFSTEVSLVAQANRKLLRDIMHKYNFKPYNKEWWHFTMHREPFPRKYFDFDVA